MPPTDTPEVDAVIAALAADEAHLAGVAPGSVIGERDLERGVDRLRAGVGKEHVVEAGRRNVDQFRRTLERLRVAHLECAGEVELIELPADRLGDLRPPMSAVDAP